jgi:enamine deaminase RidA (YjgF/YER057c/UK114 family)
VEKAPIRTEEAPAPFQGAPYSQAIRAGELVFRQHVGEVPPARATVEVSALPAGALVEIDAIALA